ncbi:MAG: glycosyltransferase family protein [Methanobrevibacter sp.]|jgi:spore coat polysaccharide biosynthesis protein SpsF|nr:glycosyltransferase family protein [Candidatus Methanovirga procula]
MKIGAIIQGRTTSTRLPKKILKNLPYDSNITVLEQVINRLKRSKLLDELIIATTINDSDDEIVEIAKRMEVPYYRGDEFDVLERYYQSAKKFNIDVVVRITSDCPCVDHRIVDKNIRSYINKNVDYSSNSLNGKLIRGFDVEVINFQALKKLLTATEDFEREHVTPYLYLSYPKQFNINIVEENGLNIPGVRVTLDTEEDYTLLCTIFDYLYYDNPDFSANDVVNLFEKKPWLKNINKNIKQKKLK